MAVLARAQAQPPWISPAGTGKPRSKKTTSLDGVFLPLPLPMKSKIVRPAAKKIKAIDGSISITYADDLGIKQEEAETKPRELISERNEALPNATVLQEPLKSPTPLDTDDLIDINMSYQDSIAPEDLLKEVISGLQQIDARLSQPQFLKGYMRSIFGRQSIKHIHALVLMFLTNVQKNDQKVAAGRSLEGAKAHVVLKSDKRSLQRAEISSSDSSVSTSNDLKLLPSIEFEVSHFAYTPRYVGQAGKFQFLCDQNKWETPYDITNTITKLIIGSVGFQDPSEKVWASFQALLDIGHAIVTSHPDPIMLDHCQDGTIAEELVDGIILVGGLLLQRDGLVRDFEMSMTKIEAIMEFKNHEKGVYPFRELASLHADIVDYEVPRVFDVSLLKIKEALGLLNEEGTGHLSSIRGVNSQPQNPHPAFSLPSIVIEHEINFIIKPYAASKYASVETQHNALRTLAQIGYAILQARASRQVSKSHDPVFYESIIEDLVTDAMVDIGMGISLMSDDIGTGVLEDIIRLDENRGMAFLYMETVMGMIGLLGDEAREEYIEQEWKLDKNRGNA